jgi:hypothetical protein
LVDIANIPKTDETEKTFVTFFKNNLQVIDYQVEKKSRISPAFKVLV